MTTKTDILLPCPCCGAPAVTGADAEYENSNGEPAVECSSCNVMSWTVEDWNRRAAVEADRQRRMPSDEEILALAEDARVWVPMGSGPEKERSLQALRSLITTALSRYSSGQPAASANPCFCDRMYPDSNPDATCGDCPRDYRPAASAEPAVGADDDAVDHFAAAMKDKLAQARAKGRYGWREIDPSDLSMMLRSHVDKGDPRDVANFCMFLWSLGKPISAAPAPAAQEPVYQVQYNHEGWRDASASRYEAVGKAMAYSGASRWERRIVYAAPVAQEPIFWINPKIVDPQTGRIAGHVNSALTWSLTRCAGWSMPVYAAPVAAQAQQPASVADELPAAKMVAGCCGRSECGGECGNEWVGMVPAEPDTQDQEDAERYRLLRRGQHWSVIDGIGNTLRADELDAAIDAARAAKGADHG